MARDNYLHFRVSDELMHQINELAASTPGGNKSRVCRLLLATSLENDLAQAAVLEAIFEYAGLRKRIVNRLASEISDRIPTIIAEETALADDAAA